MKKMVVLEWETAAKDEESRKPAERREPSKLLLPSYPTETLDGASERLLQYGIIRSFLWKGLLPVGSLLSPIHSFNKNRENRKQAERER